LKYAFNKISNCDVPKMTNLRQEGLQKYNILYWENDNSIQQIERPTGCRLRRVSTRSAARDYRSIDERARGKDLRFNRSKIKDSDCNKD
jgi:hypothetical protein